MKITHDSKTGDDRGRCVLSGTVGATALQPDLTDADSTKLNAPPRSRSEIDSAKTPRLESELANALMFVVPALKSSKEPAEWLSS